MKELNEMPVGIGKIKTFSDLKFDIKDRIRSGLPVIDIIDGFKNMSNFYWHESNGVITIATQIENTPEGFIKISITGRDKNANGPRSWQLYNAILKHTKHPVLFSDNKLSDEGYTLWTNMMKNNAKIGLYDKNTNQITPLQSIDDMAKYFSKTNKSYDQFQYVLYNEHLEETKRLKTLAGL